MVGKSLRAGGGGNQLKARRLRVCFEATGRVRVTPDLAALVVRDAGLEVLPQDKNLPRRLSVDSRHSERREGKKGRSRVPASGSPAEWVVPSGSLRWIQLQFRHSQSILGCRSIS
jgi:hypothetical protein